MPKANLKSTEEYVKKTSNKWRTEAENYMESTEKISAIGKAKIRRIIQGKASVLKKAKVRQIYLNLTRPEELDRVSRCIDSNSNDMDESPDSTKSKGKRWKDSFEKNVLSLCLLVSEALTHTKKLVEKKDEEHKKLNDIIRKTNDFTDSCLKKLKAFTNEDNKPFQIDTNNTSRYNYYFKPTPFQ